MTEYAFDNARKSLEGKRNERRGNKCDRESLKRLGDVVAFKSFPDTGKHNHGHKKTDSAAD